jgi:hypothetical protein
VFTLNGTAVQMNLSINGNVALTDTLAMSPGEAASFSEHQTIGLGLYDNASVPAELYMDDVVFSRTPVGCP